MISSLYRNQPGEPAYGEERWKVERISDKLLNSVLIQKPMGQITGSTSSTSGGKSNYNSTGSGWSQSGGSSSKQKNNFTRFKAFNFDKRGSKSYTKQTMPLSHFAGHNMWMLKATNLNRGRGIHVFKDISNLKKLIEEYCKGMEKGAEGSPPKKRKDKL